MLCLRCLLIIKVHSMSDNTTISTGTGGDVIRTISRSTSTQDPNTGVITTVEVKTQAIEILTGAENLAVSEVNPLQVADTNVRRLLEQILDAIERNTEAIERLE